MRQIEIQTLGRIEIPDDWNDSQIKAHILALRNKAIPKAMPVPSMKFRGAVEINCIESPGAPIVRGDLGNIIEELQKKFPTTLKWQGDWWRIKPSEVGALVDMLTSNGYKVDVKVPPKGSAPAETTAQRSGEPTPAAPAVVVVHGTIQRSQAGMAGTSPVRDVTLLLADKTKPSYRCWDKNFFECLDAGLGKVAVLEIKQNKTWWNIETVKSIAGKEYDENGKAIIQQKDREAGGRTLFP